MRQLGDDGSGYQNEHCEAAEVGGEEASVGGQDGGVRLCGGRVQVRCLDSRGQILEEAEKLVRVLSELGFI